MSHYNSENTHILATHMQSGGNSRMLLMHTCEDGRHEFVIGSYFKKTRYDGALGYERWDYEWDRGHYFGEVIDAADYWKREVLERKSLAEPDDNGWASCPDCGGDVYDTDFYCSTCGTRLAR